MKAGIAVVLDQNDIVPARTEIILEGRLVQSPKAEIDMIAPQSNDLDNGMHVAYTVVCPKGRNVFLRVMNAQSKPRELKFGTKVATFIPLVQSHSKTNSGNCSVKIDNAKDSKNRLEEVINCDLDQADKNSVLAVLSEFKDVFEATFGHTNVATHTIDTGNSTPIKQRPCRLSYAYRDEADKQIKAMFAR